MISISFSARLAIRFASFWISPLVAGSLLFETMDMELILKSSIACKAFDLSILILLLSFVLGRASVLYLNYRRIGKNWQYAGTKCDDSRLGRRWCEVKKRGKLRIVIKFNKWYRFEEILEKKIMPLKKKYPYADIHIEVSN